MMVHCYVSEKVVLFPRDVEFLKESTLTPHDGRMRSDLNEVIYFSSDSRYGYLLPNVSITLERFRNRNKIYLSYRSNIAKFCHEINNYTYLSEELLVIDMKLRKSLNPVLPELIYVVQNILIFIYYIIVIYRARVCKIYRNFF